MNRETGGDTVAQTAQLFREREELAIGISPEGTRRPVTSWHKGFWYIAQRADVPIIIVYIDYKLKECGIHGVLRVTGDVKRDMDTLKASYSRCTPKHPNNFMV